MRQIFLIFDTIIDFYAYLNQISRLIIISPQTILQGI